MERGQVNSQMVIAPRPPSSPGVYLFLDSDDRIMYIGMAHDLEKVLYRYRGLAGRQKMRDRAAEGAIAGVAWLRTSGRAVPPSLESILISRYEPPWNTQHNPSPRLTTDAVPLTADQIDWIHVAAGVLADALAGLANPSDHPRSARRSPAEARTGYYGRSPCRDLILESMVDLELKTGETQFGLDRIVKNALRLSDAYRESTLRTHVTSVMCADAPAHHLNHSDDLRRVSRGIYERIERA